MDTRYWGPSGWVFLHLIATQAHTLPLAHLRRFFIELPWVLPCKYCRASLHDYYVMDPVPHSKEQYPHWMFRIHNRVNAKLRDQKLLKAKDPSWETIQKLYKHRVSQPCTTQSFDGTGFWDFLFSVAYTTPSRTSSSPMPNAPPSSVLNTEELRNRWGLSPLEERQVHIQRWWNELPHVLPFAEWRAIWKNNTPNVRDGKRKVTAWLYGMERRFCAAFKSHASPYTSYKGLCSNLSRHSSGCGKTRNLHTKTCRATRKLRTDTSKSQDGS